MIIAVPMVEDQLCLHFGHCENLHFAVDTTENDQKLKNLCRHLISPASIRSGLESKVLIL